MTSFEDGPAAGKVLCLARAPLYLRVVVRSGDGEVDALDQLDDAPESQEAVHAYERVGEAGSCHVDSRDRVTGRRIGRTYACAEYRHCDVQPPDEVMRDNGRWAEWATAKAKEGG